MKPRNLSPPSILFLDVETSGLYQNHLAIEDEGQPWAQQISAALCNTAGVFTNHFSSVIKAGGREVKPAAYQVHGITRTASSQVGIPESRALGMLLDFMSTTTEVLRVVTFSDFDIRIVTSLFARFAVSQSKPPTTYDKKWAARPHISFIDLQKPFCQQVCEIPTDFDDGSFKWPTLDEAASIMLGREPRDGFHDAYEDLVILKDLYFDVQRRGLILNLDTTEKGPSA